MYVIVLLLLISLTLTYLLFSRNPSIPDELSVYAASCLKCARRLSTHFEKTQGPFTLSPPGSSELALRREHKY